MVRTLTQQDIIRQSTLKMAVDLVVADKVEIKDLTKVATKLEHHVTQ